MHRFFVETPLHELDDNVVLGLFLYRDDRHEIDVEFARRDEAFNAVYAVQPSYFDGHRERFRLDWDGATTHEINWGPRNISFRSLQGYDLNTDDVIHRWRFQGDGIPQESDALRIQINLWLRDPALATEPVEVVIAGLEMPGCSNAVSLRGSD